jgi:hypothetical protein
MRRAIRPDPDMADEAPPRDAPFLKRWSQRKLAASREASAPVRVEPAPPSAGVPAASAAPQPAGDRLPADAKVELPPVESLTFDSDFTAFLKPGVDDSLRRTALRKLFSDPRFNVMDGLDVYIDDYNTFVPIPEDMIAKLEHARYLFNPPKTRVNAMGYVEDVPEEEGEEREAALAGEPPAAEELPASLEAETAAPPAPSVQPLAEATPAADPENDRSR